jgi:hypothetical protein
MMVDELVNRVDQYLGNDSSLGEFEAWFYDLAFDIERRWSGRVVDIAHQIEGILAEASSAGWSEAEIRSELDFAVQNYRQHPLILRLDNQSGWRAIVVPLLKSKPFAI